MNRIRTNLFLVGGGRIGSEEGGNNNSSNHCQSARPLKSGKSFTEQEDGKKNGDKRLDVIGDSGFDRRDAHQKKKNIRVIPRA